MLQFRFLQNHFASAIRPNIAKSRLRKFVQFLICKKIYPYAAAEAKPQPFTNLQLELLKIYARTFDEQDLLEIKRLLGQYFADKASDLAHRIWKEKELTEEKILGKHSRTPYRSKSAE